MNGLSLSTEASLTHDLIDEDTASDRDIERTNSTNLGYTDDLIRTAQDILLHPVIFSPKDQTEGKRQLTLGIDICSLL